MLSSTSYGLHPLSQLSWACLPLVRILNTGKKKCRPCFVSDVSSKKNSLWCFIVRCHLWKCPNLHIVVNISFSEANNLHVSDEVFNSIKLSFNTLYLLKCAKWKFSAWIICEAQFRKRQKKNILTTPIFQNVNQAALRFWKFEVSMKTSYVVFWVISYTNPVF